MDMPDNVRFSEGYAVYRPLGKAPIGEAVIAITEVLQYSYEHKVQRLLIDITGLTRLKNPSLAVLIQRSCDARSCSGLR